MTSAMASYSNIKSVHRTLSALTPDVVTITNRFDGLVVANREGTDYLWVKEGADTGFLAEEDGSDFIPPGEELIIDRPGNGTVTVVGNANSYSVYGITKDGWFNA
jgi:hypothetical protein